MLLLMLIAEPARLRTISTARMGAALGDLAQAFIEHFAGTLPCWMPARRNNGNRRPTTGHYDQANVLQRQLTYAMQRRFRCSAVARRSR
jgi:hypothetical protein